MPSQSSFVSTIPLPQLILQSSSLLLLQPVGQHPSPFAQPVMSEKRQAALQSATFPVRESEVHARPSSQVVGQFPSQVSPASTILFEQMEAQSSSLRLLHPEGQQPSPILQVIISVKEQVALQVSTEPTKLSAVQLSWSSQLTRQSPSQVSPGSRRPFPQIDGQSLSERASHPLGQQPSSPAQVTMVA